MKDWIRRGVWAGLVGVMACGGATEEAPPVHVPTNVAGQAGTGDAESAALSITAEDVIERIGIIAHDSMAGRDTPSPELDAVAEWAAAAFAHFGLEPGGDDGSFIQRYPLTVTKPDLSASHLDVGGERFSFGEDLSLPWTVPSSAEAEAEVVLVTGSGDWARLVESGDLSGRHVVWVSGSGAGGIRGRDVGPFLRAIFGAENGPASLFLASSADDETWQEAWAAAQERTSVTMGDGSSSLPIFEIRDGSVDRLLAGGGTAADLRSQTEVNVRPVGTATLVLQSDTERTTAPNTVGILRGSDPALADEAIVFSAHMDHVGTGRADDSGDNIFNGADDDASGTSVIIELAEAYASMDPAPTRSMIFLPNRLVTRSTNNSDVLPRSSRKGFNSARSMEVTNSESLNISMIRCASR